MPDSCRSSREFRVNPIALWTLIWTVFVAGFAWAEVPGGETCGPGGYGPLDSLFPIIEGAVETDGECNLMAPVENPAYVGEVHSRPAFRVDYRFQVDRSELTFGRDDKLTIFRLEGTSGPIIEVYLEGQRFGRVVLGAFYWADNGIELSAGTVDLPSERCNVQVSWQGSTQPLENQGRIIVNLNGDRAITIPGLDFYYTTPTTALQGVIETEGEPQGTYRFRPIDFTWQYFRPSTVTADLD